MYYVHIPSGGSGYNVSVKLCTSLKSRRVRWA